MLKYRLIFGTLMVVVFVGLVLLDGELDIPLSGGHVQGTVLCIMIVLLAIPAGLEMAQLAGRVGAVIFRPVTIIASALLATSWYWRQFYPEPLTFHLYYLLAVCVITVLGLFVYQARVLAGRGVIVNCGVNLLSIFYLGLFSGFVPAIRIEHGVWALLMFIFTVKSSDIGAYTIGTLWGRHKFSPVISPGKTWEGLAGAVLFAAIAAVLFSVCCDIMPWRLGLCFGVIFAPLGQLGDLAESMIKRDAEQKDSAGNVPGFGGVLDVIDSPLATAPLAYAFFKLAGV